jgi:hypothetical protein
VIASRYERAACSGAEVPTFAGRVEFATGANTRSPAAIGDVVFGDFNGDGKLDLATANTQFVGLVILAE